VALQEWFVFRWLVSNAVYVFRHTFNTRSDGGVAAAAAAVVERSQMRAVASPEPEASSRVAGSNAKAVDAAVVAGEGPTKASPDAASQTCIVVVGVWVCGLICICSFFLLGFLLSQCSRSSL